MARFGILHKRGFSWEHFSPEINAYGDDFKEKCKRGGVFFWADRELYIGLGFNTKVVPVNDAPKNYAGLLDPKWKARSPSPEVSAIPLEATSQIRWDESLSKSSAAGRQGAEYRSGGACQSIRWSPVKCRSPDNFRFEYSDSEKKRRPVEWRPLEPVLTNVGSSGMTTRSPHPHAALLFLDYLHSKEGQQVVMKGGLNFPRDDMDVDQKFKMKYLEINIPWKSSREVRRLARLDETPVH